MRDYASPADVMAAIEQYEFALDDALARLAAVMPAAGELARSVRADHDRHRSARAGLRRRLALSPTAAADRSPAPPLSDIAVERVRIAAQELVYAHAEGLPAIGDAVAVDVLARHMVDDARHLAILQMWAEAEQDA